MEELKLYTVEEVANILQVQKRTIYDYINRGQLKAIKMGKYWRVKPEHVKEFIDAREFRP